MPFTAELDTFERAFMKKLTASLAICGILGLVLIAIPGHLAETTPHEDCPTCQFLHHTPILLAENPPIVQYISESIGLAPLDRLDTFSEPVLDYTFSRAPPLL
jgi:hypothetical protein